jgi:signal transduction histidine kinase
VRSLTEILGRYRELVVAVALFLLFDLGVLVLNYYTSFQIAQDATAINLAGRQRMLSQRMTKALLAAQAAQEETARAKYLEELGTAAKLFGSTLTAFERGGRPMGTAGAAVALDAVSDEAARAQVRNAQAHWGPIQQALEEVLDSPGDGLLPQAVEVALRHNVELLGLMNALTTRLEVLAAAKAQRLRLVQAGGIGLAIANFFFILMHFIKRLNQGDQRLAEAQQENKEILDTVREGLFLLDKELRMGSQFAAVLPRILGKTPRPHAVFLDLLRDMVPEKTLSTTKDYLELLLSGRVRESLVASLNPLSEVEVLQPTPGQEGDTRFLSFHFNRVKGSSGQFSHLLVTVADITERVRLARELEATRRQTESEMNLLLGLLHVESGEMLRFLAESEQRMLKVNDVLRDSRTGEAIMQAKVKVIFPMVHAVKGDAAALRLEFFESLAQDMERVLAALRQRKGIGGGDLLPLAVHLNRFLARIGQVRNLSKRLAALQKAMASPDESRLDRELGDLAGRVASDLGKQARLDLEGAPPEGADIGHASPLRSLLIQMVRNAVSHGIEAPEARRAQGKPAMGQVRVRFEPGAQPGFARLSVRDDGAGIDPARIRDKLLRDGRYTREQLAEFAPRDLLMRIFDSGFTTAEQAGAHAGHGVGMDVVAQQARALGGHIRLHTKPGVYTEFLLDFQLSAAGVERRAS